MFQKETLQKNIVDLETKIKEATEALENKNRYSPGQLTMYRKMKTNLSKKLEPLKQKFNTYYAKA